MMLPQSIYERSMVQSLSADGKKVTRNASVSANISHLCHAILSSGRRPGYLSTVSSVHDTRTMNDDVVLKEMACMSWQA